jgi:hypothetical protein
MMPRRPSGSFAVFAALALGAFAAFWAARPLSAQAVGSSGDAECYRFSFGQWTPPLDWTAAGHSGRVPHAPAPSSPTSRREPVGGAVDSGNVPPSRESAIVDSAGRAPMLVLFPDWWPAGVAVDLPRNATRGDTVHGVARAFVADAHVRPPTSAVMAWRVPCAGRSP